ncbi:hypothetical protein GLV93_08890, partial [Staphylococcus agnetis]|nr:hypothetical protein [Staphylococcus agnetis]
ETEEEFQETYDFIVNHQFSELHFHQIHPFQQVIGLMFVHVHRDHHQHLHHVDDLQRQFHL